MRSKIKHFYGLITLAFVTLFIAVSATSASAHDTLIDSNPKEGETLTQNLEVISLTFNSTPQDVGVEALLTDASGVTTSLTDYQISGNTLDLAVPQNIGGALKLSWRVVSSDGHAISGELNFTAPELVIEPRQITESVSPTPTDEPSKEASSETAVSQSPSEDGTGEEDARDPESEGLPWTGIIIGGVFALSGVVAVVITDFNKRAKAARNTRNGR